jgi:hypothetical protein
MDNLQKLLNTTPNDPNTAKFLAAFTFKLSEPDDFNSDQYMTASADGIELVSNDGIIKTILLFAQGQDGHQQYKGALPAGLSFGSRRKEVTQKLGQPIDFQKDRHGMGGWVCYHCVGYCLQFVFNPTLEMVVLATLDVAP